MKRYGIISLMIFCLAGCKPAVEAPPHAPTSVEAVKKILVGKSYITTDVGLMSHFANDTTIDWMSQSKDTTFFFKNYQKGLMALTIKFTNDTAFESMDDGKVVKGTYVIDNENRPGIMSDDKPETFGIKLRMSVADTAYGIFTATNYIKGIDGTKLMLAMPREMNERKVVALMKSN